MLSILRPSTRLAEDPDISIGDCAVMVPPRVAATRTPCDDQIEVEWVEPSVLDQFAAVAAGKVDAALCRRPLSHDGLVQCAVLSADKRKLVVPAGHRLVRRSLIDPEELALETLPTLPENHQLGRGRRPISRTIPPLDGRLLRGLSWELSGNVLRSWNLARQWSSLAAGRSTTTRTPASGISRLTFHPWGPLS
jgi:DNA-binding transcriptional LysR family regulator